MTALAKVDTELAEDEPLPPIEQKKEEAPLPRDDRVWRYALEPRPTAPREHVNRLDRGYKTPRHRAAPMAPRVQPRRKPPLFRTRDIVLAAALILVAGAATGAVVYDRLENGILLNKIKSFMPQQAAMEAAPKITVISHKAEQAPLTPSRKKPISTARVDVTPVTGTTNAMIPLSLKVSAAVPQETLAFKLSGLPESAYLTAGIRMGKDQWILKPAEAENARLVIPKAPAPQFTIEVAAVEVASGELVSPYVSMQVALTESPASVPFPATAAIIMPAAAPREIATNFNTGTQSAARDVVMITKENTAQPLPIPVEARQPEDSQARKLMEDGDSLMESGDLAAARAFYSQAMSLGVKEAAFAMGQTYDPSVFAEKKVLGLKPDTAQALRYYQLAATAGVAEARDAMSALQARLEQ